MKVKSIHFHEEVNIFNFHFSTQTEAIHLYYKQIVYSSLK